MTAAQEHLRHQTDKYWAVVGQGQRYDTGIPYGLMETQLALALNGVHRVQICEAIARISGDAGQGMTGQRHLCQARSFTPKYATIAGSETVRRHFGQRCSTMPSCPPSPPAPA